MAQSPRRKTLVIYGAAHAVCLRAVDHINRETPTWTVAGFLDDTPDMRGRSRCGYPVLGGRELLAELAADPNVAFFNNVRGHWSRTMEVTELLDGHGCAIAGLVHPSVDLEYVEIGRGCYVGPGCQITVENTIGSFVTIFGNSVTGHHVTIEDYAFVGALSSIGSNSTLRARSFLGAGAIVTPGVTVGLGSVVAAGAVATRDVPDGVTVMGVPARPVK